MRAVLTRVSSAQVTVDDAVVGAIDCPETCGILALIGVTHDDGPDACDTMVRKIAELRILPDEKSVTDVGAPVLVVSHLVRKDSERSAPVVVRRSAWQCC